jgi:hypothetical protein
MEGSTEINQPEGSVSSGLLPMNLIDAKSEIIVTREDNKVIVNQTKNARQKIGFVKPEPDEAWNPTLVKCDADDTTDPGHGQCESTNKVPTDATSLVEPDPSPEQHQPCSSNEKLNSLGEGYQKGVLLGSQT